MAMGLDCWEFKKCGREPGGAKVHEMGVCPASTMKEAHGLNRGTNGGRACWAVVGTFCGGKVQDSLAMKLHHCVGCDFRELVHTEEGASCLGSTAIVDRMRAAAVG